MQSVEIVEVGPRDGYQGIGPFIPSTLKIEFLKRLAAAGLHRIEIGSFVSATALPQLRDTPEILAAAANIAGLKPQVLVPSERRGRDAVAPGARALVFVLSVSEAHNRNNVRRHPLESAEEYASLIAAVRRDVFMRLDIATAFDCPFDGRIDEAATTALLERLIPLRPDAEICLCDTTGRADPAHVDSLFAACMQRFSQVHAWALHPHDTYGLGLANVHAAYRRGVRVFDASFGGLGGCPFAPGATGNVATEDVLFLLNGLGIETGVSIDGLIDAAEFISGVLGRKPVSRSANALLAKRAAAAEKAAT